MNLGPRATAASARYRGEGWHNAIIATPHLLLWSMGNMSRNSRLAGDIDTRWPSGSPYRILSCFSSERFLFSLIPKASPAPSINTQKCKRNCVARENLSTGARRDWAPTERPIDRPGLEITNKILFCERHLPQSGYGQPNSTKPDAVDAFHSCWEGQSTDRPR